MQKKLIFISGTIGSGKSTLTKKLVHTISNSVMLDGDWCFYQGKTWYFNNETKIMAINNIIKILNSYLNNSKFKNIFFCWTMHNQETIDKILNSLSGSFEFTHFSLICDDKILKQRIIKRNKNRSNKLGIPYSDKNTKEDILGALKKKDFYNQNSAIKLNGNKSLECLYNEIINYLDL